MDTLPSVEAFDPVTLASSMERESGRRTLIQKYIRDALVEGTDFGTIRIAGRESKPCLFKPGAEKFCSLLQLRAEFTMDADTIGMLGAKAEGVLAYVCRLVHIASGVVIAEGRGACSVAEKQGIANTAIKIAEKRAQIDAVLRLGLSDSFTQDEDFDAQVANAQTKPVKTIVIDDTPPPPNATVTEIKGPTCTVCGALITQAIVNFSTKMYGTALCFRDQKRQQDAQAGQR